MIAVSLPPGGGKSTAVLNWMRSAPDDEIRVCVCFSIFERDRMRVEGAQIGLGSSLFRCFTDAALGDTYLTEHRTDKLGVRIVYAFDNVDQILNRILKERRVGGSVQLTTSTQGEI